MLLERFASAQKSDSGVDHWDVANVTTEGLAYFVARGYRVTNGERQAVMEIVTPSRDARRSHARGARAGEPIALGERARAVAGDLEAIAAALGAPRASRDLQGRSIRPRAGSVDCEAGDTREPAEGQLVSPCPTRLLVDCAAESSAAASAAREAAAGMADGAPTATSATSAAPPASASLGEGGPAADRTCVTASGSLDLNDVSVLFPLTPGERDDLLTATHPVASGTLLPRAAFGRLPSPFVPTRSGDALYAALRVVSARIDPCFPRDSDNCTNQVRFVLQAVDDDGARVSVDDSAIHVFFTVSRDDFAELARGLSALKRDTESPSTGGALRVHPGLQQRGLRSPYAQRLRELLISTSARGQLTRVTFIARGGEVGKENTWRFGGFDVAGDVMTRLAIASLPGRVVEQTISADRANSNRSVSPETPTPDGYALGALFAPAGAPTSEIQAAYEAALRIENPRLAPRPHTSESLDCASCHLATPLRTWAEAQRRWTLAGPSFSSPSFDLENTARAAMADTVVTRAFSYLNQASGAGASPVISQRTINESAVVAEYITTRILDTPR